MTGRRLCLAAALVATLLGACGGGGGGKLAAPTAEETKFCKAILPEVWTGDQAKFNEITKTHPENFDPKDDKGVVAWIEAHCFPNIGADAAERDQRLAVPRGTDLKPLQTCLAATSPKTIPNASIVLYGQGDDPYGSGKEMIGVTTGGATSGSATKQTPIDVRGVHGFWTSIPVTANNLFERLGVVIIWDEGGKTYSLVGRQWDRANVNALAALADKLVPDGNDLVFPADALPDGYSEVYRGQAQHLALVSPFTGVYEVEMRDGTGLINISGRVLTKAEEAATQFFTLDLQHAKVGGHDNALVGHPWDSDQTSIVQWRDKSGLVVRVMAVGEPLERVKEVAGKVKSLTRKQWADLAVIPTICDSFN